MGIPLVPRGYTQGPYKGYRVYEVVAQKESEAPTSSLKHPKYRHSIILTTVSSIVTVTAAIRIIIVSVIIVTTSAIIRTVILIL